MDSRLLLERTKGFALKIIKFCQKMPKSYESRTLGNQLLRAGTSVAANYRAACRARSDKEFYAKLCIVVEENDETLFWLELIDASHLADESETKELMDEAEELLRIFSSSRKTLKNRISPNL